MVSFYRRDPSRQTRGLKKANALQIPKNLMELMNGGGTFVVTRVEEDVA